MSDDVRLVCTQGLMVLDIVGDQHTHVLMPREAYESLRARVEELERKLHPVGDGHDVSMYYEELEVKR